MPFLHRIIIDMVFTDQDPMDDILDKVKDLQDQAITMNPGSIKAEHSSWQTQECNHGQDHDGPCVDTGHWQSP